MNFTSCLVTTFTQLKGSRSTLFVCVSALSPVEVRPMGVNIAPLSASVVSVEKEAADACTAQMKLLNELL